MKCSEIEPKRCRDVGKAVATLSRCVFVVLYESCESKVGNLADELMRDENIGSSQISMNVIFLLNKCHAVSHLQGTAQDKRSMSVCVCSSTK